MTRRDLLAATAAAAAFTAFGHVAAFGEAANRSTVQSERLKLKPFSYHDVKLASGPLKEQYDHALGVFLKLDEDRILKVYREATGLPAPGEPMGGWYNLEGFGPGHALGQWMSALSRFAANGSAEAGAKVARLVDGFDATLKTGKPFHKDLRFPAYIYDKHVIGLTDAYRYAKVERAREVLARATEMALPYLPEKALTREEMRKRPHKDVTYTWDESYTIAENLFISHEVFGDARYLEMAKRYLHDEPYFDRLARGEPAMVGEHAYSHANALGSAAMAYVSLGTEKHLKAIRNAWDMIVRDQSYASGGWGPKEEFVEPGKGKLFESLATTRNHFETPCGSYATIKLGRYLMEITGESGYGDGLERVLYNGILAAKRIQPDGRNFYYSDYQDFARKVYHPDKWTCCTGTYPQAVSDYPVDIYFHDDEGIVVNLYVPSEVRWGEVTLKQTTNYPEDGVVKIAVDAAKEKAFAMRLRIPSWAGADASVKVNGTAVGETKGGTFSTIQRTWKAGDTVELTLPMKYRAEPIDGQHPQTVALMRGPALYVAVTDQRMKLDRVQLEAGQPAPAVVGRLMPFYKVNDELYTTYFTQT